MGADIRARAFVGALPDRSVFNSLMYSLSEQTLEQVKDLVERIMS